MRRQEQERNQNSERNSDWNRTEDHFGTGHRFSEEHQGRNDMRNGRHYDRMDRMDQNKTSFGSGHNTYRRESNFDTYGSDYGQQSMGMERSGHFGKGPKGYRRSDERIKEEVCEALYRASNVDASEIEVDVKEGTVTLKGTVEERESKRAAESCIENLSGVEDVRNEIRVLRATGSMSSTNQMRNQKLA